MSVYDYVPLSQPVNYMTLESDIGIPCACIYFTNNAENAWWKYQLSSAALAPGPSNHLFSFQLIGSLIQIGRMKNMDLKVHAKQPTVFVREKRPQNCLFFCVSSLSSSAQTRLVLRVQICVKHLFSKRASNTHYYYITLCLDQQQFPNVWVFFYFMTLLPVLQLQLYILHPALKTTLPGVSGS